MPLTVIGKTRNRLGRQVGVRDRDQKLLLDEFYWKYYQIFKCRSIVAFSYISLEIQEE